jgi:hypothetical protein
MEQNITGFIEDSTPASAPPRAALREILFVIDGGRRIR